MGKILDYLDGRQQMPEDMIAAIFFGAFFLFGLFFCTFFLWVVGRDAEKVSQNSRTFFLPLLHDRFLWRGMNDEEKLKCLRMWLIVSMASFLIGFVLAAAYIVLSWDKILRYFSS
jgi:hypothetical protein